MKIGHVREVLGKVELGRRSEAEVRKVGKRPKKKTPRPAWRHAPPQGSSGGRARGGGGGAAHGKTPDAHLI